jgi:aspartyl-tRNA(Asn)/glutamyl-tRNA(Gln) amidotransferase subunit A
MMEDIAYRSITELKGGLLKGEFSSSELLEIYLDRIARKDHLLNSFVAVHDDHARQMALQADSDIKQGKLGLLTGIPIAVKDIFMTKGFKTTCGSKILKDYIPQYSATVVKKLEAAGAIIVGKNNMDEFGFGATTENSCFGPSKNPHNLKYTPGGSSGGSSAAVAGGLIPASMGTDTGGSVRQPASFCGVVGIKPTYGRVSRFGVNAFASSLDQVGPIAREVVDAALLLEAIAGYDPSDTTTIKKDVPNYSAYLSGSVTNLRIGVPKEFLSEDIDPEVRKCFSDSISILKDLGVKTVDINLPHVEAAIAAYYIIATSEASSNLARFDGVRYGPTLKSSSTVFDLLSKNRGSGFGEEAKRRIILGTYSLSAGYYDGFYKKASQVRRLIKDDFKNAFEKCDLVISPTSADLPMKLGSVTDPLEMYKSDVFNVPANLAGLPAMSIPCGFSKANLPIGLQLYGNYFKEDVIFSLAKKLEEVLNCHLRKPSF